VSEALVGSELVDVERLGTWLDGCGLEVGLPITVAPLTSGRSNAMFTVHRGASRWVLRRPAAVAIERADEGMRREYRILDALTGSNVPHPETVALCDDHDVLGCTFFLMQQVDGVNPAPPLPDPFTVADQSGVAFAMVDALAALHDFDWRGSSLSDFGKPDGFHERQVERWTTQLASYNGRELPELDRVTRFLSEHLPGSFEPSLMHGDFHMFNALISSEPPGEVTAIIDWETATIGDPLLDLIGFCEIWGKATAGPGWPRRDELIARYREQRDLELPSDLSYYEVLYNFRMAVLLEGIYQRSLHDGTRPDLVDVGAGAMGFLERALEVLDQR
jgi:aminoglycoside phosphotransferase (APT) family kinase protein